MLIVEYNEYLTHFFNSLQLHEDLLEETLILSFLSFLQSPSKSFKSSNKSMNQTSKINTKTNVKNITELQQIVGIISHCISHEMIIGKRLYLVLLEEILNGYSSQNKLILLKLINEVTQWKDDWNQFRAIGCIVFNAIQFKGELEKERMRWLIQEDPLKKNDIESLSESQFSQLYSLIVKNEI